MDGKGADSIGTCHTAVITGFVSHPLKHWSIPIIDKTSPERMIRSQRILEIKLLDVPRKDIPCKVDWAVKDLNTSLNDGSVSSKNIDMNKN